MPSREVLQTDGFGFFAALRMTEGALRMTGGALRMTEGVLLRMTVSGGCPTPPDCHAGARNDGGVSRGRGFAEGKRVGRSCGSLRLGSGKL